MDKVSQFYDIIKKNMGVTLATASNQNVSMRTVSPVYYEGNILIFTDPNTSSLRTIPIAALLPGIFLQKPKQNV